MARRRGRMVGGSAGVWWRDDGGWSGAVESTATVWSCCWSTRVACRHDVGAVNDEERTIRADTVEATDTQVESWAVVLVSWPIKRSVWTDESP
jgi:hypothetical protein